MLMKKRSKMTELKALKALTWTQLKMTRPNHFATLQLTIILISVSLPISV